MADHAGSARICAVGREGGVPSAVSGAQVVTVDYLDELKRFAAALNGLPEPEVDDRNLAPAQVAGSPPSGEPSRPPPPVDDRTAVEGGEQEWWRALEARLAKAPRRPRFVVRHSGLHVPPVTHTAAPTETPIPPPQLRRQIDIGSEPGDEARPTRRTGWDRLDCLFGAAGLTVVLLGAIAASAPVGTGAVRSNARATIDIPLQSVEISPVVEPRRPDAPRAAAGPLTPLLPAPPPFPITVALVSEGAVGAYVGPIGDRAFRPIALSGGPTLEPSNGPGPAALVDSAKAIDIARQQELFAPRVSEAEAVVDSGVELIVEAQSLLVRQPIPAPRELLPVNASAANGAKVAAAASSDPDDAAGSKNNWLVHLVSVRDEDGAAGEWARLQRQYRALGSLELTVKRVDLGDKGTWFRVFAGPLEDRQDALRLCAALTDLYCQPLPNDRG